MRKFTKLEVDSEVVLAHERDGSLQRVPVFAGHPQLIILDLSLDLDLAVLDRSRDLLRGLLLDPCLMRMSWRMVFPPAASDGFASRQRCDTFRFAMRSRSTNTDASMCGSSEERIVIPSGPARSSCWCRGSRSAAGSPCARY